MTKDIEWFKEQFNYYREAVGPVSFNDHSRGLNSAYDNIESLLNQLEAPGLTQDQVDEYLRKRGMAAIGLDRLLGIQPYKREEVLEEQPLKYGAGDKVILLDDLDNEEVYGRYPFNQKTMTKLQRGLHKIIRVEESTNSYRVYDGKDDWGITDKMIDHDKTMLLNNETNLPDSIKGYKITIEEIQ